MPPKFYLAPLLAVALAATLFAGCCTKCATCPQKSSPAIAPTDKMKWFNEARFGLFIHWGIYSVPAGEWNGQNWYGEWFQLETAMPALQYAQFASQFNPVQFDAKAWVQTAKNAGMKYIVITAKHHDGFCMFDSKLTDYNIVQATPWHQDPMKDLAHECQKAGIKFDFYYSIPDWHHPDFPARYSQHKFHGAPNPDADLDKYVAYLKGQLRELLTNYGPIGIIWFDDGGSFEGFNRESRARMLHAQDIIDEIHQLQPQCIVNNRLGLPADYGTPEQYIPGGQPTNAFEVCMTLNDHWGYNKDDQKWKPSIVIIQNLADIASKGGNYLLNVGPTSQGVFPPPAVKILDQVGDWMRVNGESIYATKASPLSTQPAWGRLTQKDHRLYLHIFNWPADGRITVNLPATLSPTRAWLLADPKKHKLPIAAISSTSGANETETTINLPPTAPDHADSVLVLETRPVSR